MTWEVLTGIAWPGGTAQAGDTLTEAELADADTKWLESVGAIRNTAPKKRTTTKKKKGS